MDPVTLLDNLAVPYDAVLYVQSSTDWLQRAGIDPAGMMRALSGRIGDRGTLVMPAYPFSMPHRDYLQGAPLYDVRSSPTATGLLPEIARRRPGAIRSLDPDFCVVAIGGDAAAIAGPLADDADPFGTESPYQRMLDRHATLVGLGVSLNTTSFIHVIDSRLRHRYPEDVYEPQPYKTTVIDRSGAAMTVLRLALRPKFQQLTRPSDVVEAMQPSAAALTVVEIDGARFFRWDLDVWSRWALDYGRSLPHGAWPCWLKALGCRAIS